MNWQDEFNELIALIKEDLIITKELESSLKENPRHLFFPPELQSLAYSDVALRAGKSQLASQPSTVVRMIGLLDIQKGDDVLEVGTSSGWQAAILSTLVGEGGSVYSLEENDELLKLAKENMHVLGRSNIYILPGSFTRGLPEAAPFDKIMVSAPVHFIPLSLVNQLKNEGKMTVLIGKDAQELFVIQKNKNGDVSLFSAGSYVFYSLFDEDPEKGTI